MAKRRPKMHCVRRRRVAGGRTVCAKFAKGAKKKK